MLVVASGRSSRHVGALADHISRKLTEAGAKEIKVEGLPHADWVLIDAGDVVVHLFRPESAASTTLKRLGRGGLALPAELSAHSDRRRRTPAGRPRGGACRRLRRPCRAAGRGLGVKAVS